MSKVIENMIWGYLDGQDFYKIEYKGDYIFYESYETYMSRFPNVQIITHRANNDCYIKPKLLREIESYFNIGMEESSLYVGSWVMNKVGFNLNKFYFD